VTEVSDLAERVHRRVTEAHVVCVMTNCALRALWVGDVQEILDAVSMEAAVVAASIEAELQTEQVRAVRASRQHVRARLEGAREVLAVFEGGAALDAIRDELSELEAQRAAALAIHQRCADDPGGPPYCRVCVQGGDDLAAPYPCSTARALGVEVES
jgi:hypothetical protein